MCLTVLQLCLLTLLGLGLTGGFSGLGLAELGFSVRGLGLFGDGTEAAPSGAPERELKYDGRAEDAPDGSSEEPSDGGEPNDSGPLFGPGDGEPAVNFRLLGEEVDGGVLSVHLNDRHLYTVGLPRADALVPVDAEDEGGLTIKITQGQIEWVLQRRMADPDLPPVKVSCALYGGTLGLGGTPGLVSVVNWNGYLQGCWLEFPELAQNGAEAEEAGEAPLPEPLLVPRVDISSRVGQAMALDVRLAKNTIYYMLFASEHRDGLLFNPEAPQIYARSRIVAGGTFSWREAQELARTAAEATGGDRGDTRPNPHLKRVKYTPRANKTYMVLWALHRAADPAAVEEPVDAAPLSEEAQLDVEDLPRVNGWSRSAIYELTNGLPEGETETADEQ